MSDINTDIETIIDTSTATSYYFKYNDTLTDHNTKQFNSIN